ncbi:apolipoprotein N-acyltransferase [Bartonella ancashensis]|uniref:Apolipoprotein N-acyltransferase n=1 Tax=Bartonella ancashensis TaxID=1318743 RepID=A0A0M4LJD2_9HYPH|nr:apolipoprotein N-acyltransferase [Bartonella ancashensis]ALE03402.1 Apolipoprotein N-acyltransferase [Bartonella ancashensis]
MFFKKFISLPLSITGWKRQFSIFLCGCLTSLALPPLSFTPICFITFPIFIIFLDSINTLKNNRARLLINALSCGNFGFGYFVCSLWWLGSALLIDQTFFWAIPFAVFGLPACLAFFWFLSGFIVGLLWIKGIARFFVLAFALGLAELLRAILFTGFPWNSLAYTAMPTPIFMQSNVIIGLYGMNILAVLAYSLPTVLLTNEKKCTALFCCFSMILAHISFGFYRLNTAPSITHYQTSEHWVRIIQPSIQQNEKWNNATQEDIFKTLLALSSAPTKSRIPKPNFIVWPETSVPYIINDTSTITMRIASILNPQQWAIVGAVRTNNNLSDNSTHYFNTIQVIDVRGNILHVSDKLHLVPFGEYIPYKSLFNKIGLHAFAHNNGYSATTTRKTVMMPNGISYLPLICYEIIFPHEMTFSGSFPQIIINVTNDAWFGMTPGPHQHFQQARLRAVELGIPLIRAANNGISAVVDPYGRVVAALKQNVVGSLDSPIPPPNVPTWGDEHRTFSTFILFILMLLCRVGSATARKFNN